MTFTHLLVLLPLLGTVFAQLPLPSPPHIPPEQNSGANPSSTSQVPNAQWSNLLGNLIYFYDAQRSGRLPDSNRVSWRNTSAVNDGSDVNLDLSGGYYDAGDYIKATYPLSFTLMSICWGAMEYGRGYDITNQTAYLDSMLRWGLDWMIKAHSSNNTLYVLIGDVERDNNYWGGDEGIPTPRPSFQINDTSPGTDAAAGASAAFSACSALYNGMGFDTNTSGPASLQNSTYAAELLTHAQQLYNFAVNAEGGQQVYQEAVPEIADAYGSSSYQDELTMAALFLSLASNLSSLYSDAENYYSQFSLGGRHDSYNWDSKTPGLSVLFSKIATFHSSIGGNLDKWRSEAENYFDDILENGEKTKGGLLWYDDASDVNSLNPALNAALLLNLYAPLATSQSKRNDYITYANGQLNYTLGSNPMNVPYVVGSNPNSPQNPHSAMASGGNDINNINTVPPQMAYVLYGAVIGGPDKKDRYFDIRNDWPQTEVALDYNAPMLSLVAQQAMSNSGDPFFTRLQEGAYDSVRPEGMPCDPAYPCRTKGQLSTGGKIAIAVVVSVVGLIVLGGIGYWLWSARRNRYRY